MYRRHYHFNITACQWSWNHHHRNSNSLFRYCARAVAQSMADDLVLGKRVVTIFLLNFVFPFELWHRTQLSHVWKKTHQWLIRRIEVLALISFESEIISCKLPGSLWSAVIFCDKHWKVKFSEQEKQHCFRAGFFCTRHVLFSVGG